MKRKLREITVYYKKGYADAVYGYLYKAGITTVSEEKNSFVFYIPETACGRIIRKLTEFPLKGLTTIKSVPFSDKNWNREWEKSVKPVTIRNRIVVYPSWLKKSLKKQSKKIFIQIDPKMSFGTGHNETTVLMLEMMTDYLDSGDKYLLDFGCGTGILAIAGIKLGMEKAVAIDTDADSVVNARENFTVNRVSDCVRLYRKSISGIREARFDVIAANIIRSVIKENIGLIHKKLKDGGKLFISGILSAEKNRILKVLKENNYKIIRIHKKAEWLGIYAVKNIKK